MVEVLVVVRGLKRCRVEWGGGGGGVLAVVVVVVVVMVWLRWLC